MPTDVQTSCLRSGALDEAAALQAHAFFNDPVVQEHRIQPRGPLVWMMVRSPRRPGRYRPRTHLERKAIGAAQRVRR